MSAGRQIGLGGSLSDVRKELFISANVAGRPSGALTVLAYRAVLSGFAMCWAAERSSR